MASKIIVTGAIDGNITAVFEKISKLQAQTAFSFAIIAGDLFADPETSTEDDDKTVKSLLSGVIKVPIPTYFTIGQHALPPRVIEKLDSSEDEVCTNLYFLGKRATTKTSEGIRIVSLGGGLDANITAGVSKDKYLPFHTEGDANSLFGANSADILLTSNWPQAVRSGSIVALPEGVDEPFAEKCVSKLCATLKPRYHFSTTSNTFFEREPFFHRSSEETPYIRPITRFISLASYTYPSKAKWLYAFSLDPTAAPPADPPSGSTVSPFLEIMNNANNKRPRQDDSTYTRYSTSQSHHRHSKRNRNQPPPGPSECFFCLSNPTLSTHLITSIATDSYLTTARGPLTLATTHPSLPFPGHILLIPLSHSPTLSSVADPDSRASTYAEMQRYRSALHSMIAAKSSGTLGAVTWEVSRQRGVHFHWQFLPVKRALVTKGLVEAAFRVEAENEQWPTFQKRDVGDGVAEGEYFRIWAWIPAAPGLESEKEVEEEGGEDSQGKGELDKAAGTEFQLVLPLSTDVRFDVQFGRRVMAKLLGLEKRIDWKDCVQTDEEETKEAEAFKEGFKQWDFSLEEED